MIRIENVDVVGWKTAIRGMRNPMNSWENSDSGYCKDTLACHTCKENRNDCKKNIDSHKFIIGPNDLDLMKRLRNTGTDHRKFMRMITVYVDITAPLYWWSEFDTYKVGTVANSTSKMHKLLSKPFEMSDFSFDQLFGYKNEVKCFEPSVDEDKEIWKPTIEDEFYYVSNYGRIKHDGRILSGSKQYDGYIRVKIRGKSYLKHRIVANAFIENPYNKPFVNHKDGNKQNNQVSNLEWCTQQENAIHAHKNNLQPRSSGTYKGKFSKEQREKIKELWDRGIMSKRKIALKYNVSHTCINDIINDKYKYAEYVNSYEECARPIVDTLNELRDAYFDLENEEFKKRIWYAILQLLPNSYNQKRTVMLNYEVLANIYKSRRDHKLDEWREFCKWIETLPYHELITGEETE